MKLKGFPHVAKQMHDVFYPTSFEFKKEYKKIVCLLNKKVFRDETLKGGSCNNPKLEGLNR